MPSVRVGDNTGEERAIWLILSLNPSSVRKKMNDDNELGLEYLQTRPKSKRSEKGVPVAMPSWLGPSHRSVTLTLSRRIYAVNCNHS